ncbi:hypothetical protein ACUA1U_004062, partial [Shigella flexneri]
TLPVFITVIADHDKPQPSGCLLESQGSLCPICRQRITHETGWNVHHKVKKVMGAVKNYLTLSCYIQIAIDSYTVVKPALSKRAYKGLSGVPGNRYAPFLGEGSPAMNCPYPTNIQNERNVLESAYNPL